MKNGLGVWERQQWLFSSIMNALLSDDYGVSYLGIIVVMVVVVVVVVGCIYKVRATSRIRGLLLPSSAATIQCLIRVPSQDPSIAGIVVLDVLKRSTPFSLFSE